VQRSIICIVPVLIFYLQLEQKVKICEVLICFVASWTGWVMEGAMARRRDRWVNRLVVTGPSALEIAVKERDASVISQVEWSLKHGRYMLAFQPIVQSAQPDKPAFWEGLMRITDTLGRIIPAADFMPQVESYELGRIIDCCALELGLAELTANPSLRLSINMSALSIDDPRWNALLRHGLAVDTTIGERLILEITEGSAMASPTRVKDFMISVQSQGVNFALDDFGAGYTALRYLRDFTFDILKIDGQFIQGIADNADNQVLVEAMQKIAKQFDMFTVAEKVERAQDADFLMNLGVDCMQGYYFSPPTVRPSWRQDKTYRRAV
jgi:EAL domain-containing protein (putative c-di-GMP-specific phosphodiesterase class I)